MSLPSRICINSNVIQAKGSGLKSVR